MKTKIKDYVVKPKATYRLKTNLLSLCDHEEGQIEESKYLKKMFYVRKGK